MKISAITSPWDALLLSGARHARFDRCQLAATASMTSKAGQIRALLKSGPLSAAAICMEVDIASTSLVGSLLKHDIAMGRVEFVNGRYRWADDYEQALQQSIRKATALLKSNGYQVVNP